MIIRSGFVDSAAIVLLNMRLASKIFVDTLTIEIVTARTFNRDTN